MILDNKQYERIKSHLKCYYHKVFSEQAIEAHLHEYIGEAHTQYLMDKIIPFVSVGSKILDIGSGYGNFVLRAVQNGYDCYGIEIAGFEYDMSKEKAKDHNIDENIFTHGTALSLPYDDASFECVTFWNVLEHVQDYKTAVLEAKRVLKPGGIIFILAPNYCAFRKEAHYHVPWLPLLPKSIAKFYLKLLRKDPRFLQNNIFYITCFGMKRFLKSLDLYISIEINEKIELNYSFGSRKARIIIRFLKRMEWIDYAKKLFFFIKTHPFSNTIDLIVKK